MLLAQRLLSVIILDSVPRNLPKTYQTFFDRVQFVDNERCVIFKNRAN